MFQTGAFIVYGNIGVCKVTGIAAPDFPDVDKSQLYYTLKPLYQNGMIYTPVNTKVFMRPIITAGEAQRLIDMIPSIRVEAYHSRFFRELAEHYEASLKNHDCADLIELTMSIHAKKQAVEQQKRKFGYVDERYMKRAEELLFGELAAALGIPKDEVPDYITERVDGEGEEK